ncbi:hypothetical protein ACTMU2_20735 [Cupriavidus basilensis]
MLHGWATSWCPTHSYEGYMDVPKDVMQGCAVADEALRQMPEGQRPTHVFLQGGVGGPAAVCAHFWEVLGDARRFIVVEPDKAACLYESARAGKPVAVHGESRHRDGWTGVWRSLTAGTGNPAYRLLERPHS